MTKAFTTPAIHFKGTGWAKKDRGSSAASRGDGEGRRDAAKVRREDRAATAGSEDSSRRDAVPASDSGSSSGGREDVDRRLDASSEPD